MSDRIMTGIWLSCNQTETAVWRLPSNRLWGILQRRRLWSQSHTHKLYYSFII